MGKIGQTLFGGSKSKQESGNKNMGMINNAFGGLMGQATEGANGLAALLGGDSSGFNKYKDATGFDFMSEQGSRGITGNAAARGLLRSGSTGKALMNYGNAMQDQYAGNYMDRLLGQAGLGMQAGGLVAGAGQYSKGKSSEKPGMQKFLGAVMASDSRLKKNIFKIGEMLNGLGIYQYRYINNKGPYIGVMAQEVLAKMPEAMGPTVDGYLTVDYSKLEGVAA